MKKIKSKVNIEEIKKDILDILNQKTEKELDYNIKIKFEKIDLELIQGSFLTPEEAQKVNLGTKELIVLNVKIKDDQEKIANCLAHELRHYWQWLNRVFIFEKGDNIFSSEYLNSNKELDALAFAENYIQVRYKKKMLFPNDLRKKIDILKEEIKKEFTF